MVNRKRISVLVASRTAWVVAVIGISLAFAAFGIVASHQTEEEDQLVYPPERSSAESAYINAAFSCPAASPTPQSCGVERWSVKTGTDTTASSVNLGSTTPTTVAALHAYPSPSPIPANSRVAPAETTQWVINGTLVEYKLESDSDYHLVVQDGSGNTIVTEIPYPGASPACVTSASPFFPGIAGARCKFDGSGLPRATTSFHTANVPVRVVGVGMFDFPHGQTGAAPNQLEIHAILDIAFPATTNSATGAGSNVTVQNGDTAITYPVVATSGTTTSVPIDPSTSGAPPAGMTLVGPAYTLSTTATEAGPINVCISVPYITDATAFGQLRLLDSEGGVLVDRTSSVNAGQKSVCGNLPSLSKVVVATGFSPTAAAVSISGRVVTAGGNGIRNARVLLTDQNGVTRTVITSAFGYYQFAGVQSGTTYVLNVSAKRFVFAPRVVALSDEVTDLELVASP